MFAATVLTCRMCLKLKSTHFRLQQQPVHVFWRRAKTRLHRNNVNATIFIPNMWRILGTLWLLWWKMFIRLRFNMNAPKSDLWLEIVWEKMTIYEYLYDNRHLIGTIYYNIRCCMNTTQQVMSYFSVYTFLWHFNKKFQVFPFFKLRIVSF